MRSLLRVVMIAVASRGAAAQRFSGEPAWKLLIEHDGVVVKYIHY